MAKPDYIAILRALAGHRVDFIVVGGVGAVLQGAPIMTFDLDLVHSTDEPNVERLLAALDSLDTHCRLIDVHTAIGRGRAYADLIQHTVELRAADDVVVRVLDLATLIATKEETAGEKDEAVLPILRQTLRERER